jgi:hypothetical protein
MPNIRKIPPASTRKTPKRTAPPVGGYQRKRLFSPSRKLSGNSMASRPMRVTDTPIPNMDKIFPKEVGLIGSSCQSITIEVIAERRRRDPLNQFTYFLQRIFPFQKRSSRVAMPSMTFQRPVEPRSSGPPNRLRISRSCLNKIAVLLVRQSRTGRSFPVGRLPRFGG